MERFRKDGKGWRFLGMGCFMRGIYELGIDPEYIQKSDDIP
jgi:hypothetical protein